MTKKLLYKDISGDLFKITSKKDHIIYLQDIITGNPLWVNESVFQIMFSVTNIEATKYKGGLIV